MFKPPEDGSRPGSRPPLTQGSVQRNLLRLALPATGSFLLSNLFTLIDTFWVGRLGTDAVGGVTMGGIVLGLVFTVAAGLSIGAEAMVSRAWGAGDRRLASHVAAQAWLAGIVLTGAFSLGGFFLAGPLLKALLLPARVAAQGEAYLEVMALGIGTIFLFVPVTASLRAVGDTVTPMKAMMASTVLNIALDPLLIFGAGPIPGMGARGAALATVIARCVGLAWLGVVYFRNRSPLRASWRALRPDLPVLVRMADLGKYAALMMLFYDASSLALMSIVAAFGEATVAAYGIVMRLFLVVLMPGFGFADAASSLVGQNLGAGKPDRAVATAGAAIRVYGGITVLLSVVLALLGGPVMGIFSPEAEVVAAGAAGLSLYAPSFVFVIVSIMLGRAMSGAGDTITPMAIAGISQLLLRVPLAWLLADAWGETGLWLSLTFSNIMNAILSALFFLRGGWKRADPLGRGEDE